MSLGGNFTAALNEAVDNSINSGVTYVVAAGNAAYDACVYSPASVSRALTVGATSSTDAQASFSDYGPCVDLFAPGMKIMSALNTDDYSTGTMSGTSMASPHVAGAAALYLQLNPSATPSQVADAIVANATTGVLTGLGAGSFNRLLRVNGSSSGGDVVELPPTSPPSENSSPVASFTVKCAQNKNSCTFDASRSSDDSGITSMFWNFGDGTAASTATAYTTTHVYMAKGVYSATLTVTDAGGLSSSATVRVTIKSISR
jgi:subtilisin family serine protease